MKSTPAASPPGHCDSGVGGGKWTARPQIRYFKMKCKNTRLGYLKSRLYIPLNLILIHIVPNTLWIPENFADNPRQASHYFVDFVCRDVVGRREHNVIPIDPVRRTYSGI